MISETKQAVEKKNIVLENKLHNRFDIEVRDAITGETKQKAQAFNVILDQFWTRLFANQSVYDYIQYGSGTGTPSASDTALFNWVAGAAASAYVYDDAHYAQGWNSFTRNIVLDEQTAVGVTITEVGLAGAANSGLCTHAMLQDMNGNPIAITKTNTDIITIYATVYIHWNVNGTNGVRYIPSSHWFGTRSTDLGLGFFTKALGQQELTYANTLTLTANAQSKSWTASLSRASISQGNMSGVSALTGAIFGVEVSGAYQITNEAVGTGDGATVEFHTAFDFPVDAKIYVDGVEQTSGVTVLGKATPSDTWNPNDYLVPIDKTSTPQIHVPAKCGRVATTSVDGVYFYNPYYAFEITNVTNYQGFVRCSQDLETWVELQQGVSVVPQAYRHYKYWHLLGFHNSPLYSYVGYLASAEFIGNQIVFDAPPAAGAVITADYKTPFLPKDSNHVYDFSLTIQLGEYNNP